MVPEVIDSYDQAIAFLTGRINFELFRGSSYSAADFKLERMRRFLELLDNPQQSVSAIHVAGTKGKGSTTAMLSAALEKSGYRTGLFTSPHLSRFEERIRIDGRMIDPAELVRLINQLLPVLKVMDSESPPLPPTYFEIATALGWLHFRKHACDFAVVEVGLGGRLDSTNICRPVVCAITSISLDHTHLLGHSITEIAREKAGIVKPGVPVISGARHADATQAIEDVSAAVGAELTRIERDFDFAPSRKRPGHFRVTTPWRVHDDIAPGMCGIHQLDNAAIACAVLDRLDRLGVTVSADAVREGIASAVCPGRFEILPGKPTTVIDVAHNEASVAALLEALRSVFPNRPLTLIFAASADKDVVSMLELLLPQFRQVILTRFDNNARGVAIDDLQAICRGVSNRSVFTATNTRSAWELARVNADEDSVIVVTGSFFLAAELREQLLQQRSVTAHP